ncbi:DEAD/DEAH box helicase [Halalkalibacillus halophilus]|uniref:DEAD/DEAH box helicase n=1 Tax=Halalkalibacillus halophilus TaxID=392827 RepID=UPI000425C13B|nr:DEAD/DEAH box helicase family protein [Halalkalibacillus halophilus]
MGRVSTNEPLYKWSGPSVTNDQIKNPLHWKGELTSLQQKASESITNTIKLNNQVVIYAVCGAGKTEMLYQGIAEAISHGKRVCLATPRADVVKELAPRFRRDFPLLQIAALYGGTQDQDHNAHLVLATTHQLLRYQQSFDVMIVDEVDAFPFHRDKTLPKAVNRAVKTKHARIYLTATPRLDMKVKIALKKLPVVSIPMRYHGYPLPEPIFQSVFQLEKKLTANKLPEKFKQWIRDRHQLQRRYLIFVPTIQLAENLSKLLKGMPHVHAASPDRDYFIERFRGNRIRALITTTILERGVTFPSIDVAVLQADHHVFDEAALIQIAGRAGRSADDPHGNVSFFYEQKTEAMVGALSYTENKNKEAKVWLE